MGCNAERQRIHSSYKQLKTDSPSVVSHIVYVCGHMSLYSHCNNDLVWINNDILSVIIRYSVKLTEINAMDR